MVMISQEAATVIGLILIMFISIYFIESVTLIVWLFMHKIFSKRGLVTLSITIVSLFPFIRLFYKSTVSHKKTQYLLTCNTIVAMIIINHRYYNTLIATLSSAFLLNVWNAQEMIHKKTKYIFTLIMFGLMIYFNDRVRNSILALIECLFLLRIWSKKTDEMKSFIH